MSSNTSKYACPKCGNPNTHKEYKANGFCYCPDCQHRWQIGESQPKPTVFDRITSSHEALADKLVYKTLVVGNNRVTYSCWRSTITEESYRTKKEASDATLEKLKEV
jgi:uncharacterized Zn finger protein (UPF0148 family)